MISPDDPDQVLTELGDKFLGAVVDAVSTARQDVEDFREFRPAWFPGMAPRTLAGLIHDRIWNTLVASDLEPEVSFYESGPTREVITGPFRIRVKRHNLGDRISNYPTVTALQFWTQDGSQLPGMEEITLAAGYRWDRDTAEVGEPVISLRDGQENVVWAVELSGGTGVATDTPTGPTPISWTPITGPELPQVGLAGDDDAAGEDTGSEE